MIEKIISYMILSFQMNCILNGEKYKYIKFIQMRRVKND